VLEVKSIVNQFSSRLNNRPKIYWKFMVLYLIICIINSIILSGCSTSTGEADVSTPPYFPVQMEKFSHGIYPQARMQGKLIIENNYFKVHHDFEPDGNEVGTFLIIWPFGYSLKIQNNQIQILNSSHIMASVGDHVFSGGGIVNRDISEKYLGQSLPADCQGPYWLASELSFYPYFFRYYLKDQIKPADSNDTLTGTLIIEREQLKLKPASGANLLLTWPSDYSLLKTNDKFQIRNQQAVIVASPGDIIQVEGRRVSYEELQKYITQPPVPKEGDGAYWIVSKIASQAATSN
jgi:hypothetical protein